MWAAITSIAAEITAPLLSLFLVPAFYLLLRRATLAGPKITNPLAMCPASRHEIAQLVL